MCPYVDTIDSNEKNGELREEFGKIIKHVILTLSSLGEKKICLQWKVLSFRYPELAVKHKIHSILIMQRHIHLTVNLRAILGQFYDWNLGKY